MSTAEPRTRPVTFRAMFIEELRARREQVGLLQRGFAAKAHRRCSPAGRVRHQVSHHRGEVKCHEH
jgi:hypothetical protein